jgi:hypothetical protein
MLYCGKESPSPSNVWLLLSMMVWTIRYGGHFAMLPGSFVKVGSVDLLALAVYCERKAWRDLRGQFLLLLYIAVAGDRDFSLHPLLPVIHAVVFTPLLLRLTGFDSSVSVCDGGR